MISEEDVQHIAKLARLGLAKREVIKFQKELSKILDYIAKLEKADVSGIEPTSYSILLENITREDKINLQKTETKENLIKAVPEEKERYIKVKSIL